MRRFRPRDMRTGGLNVLEIRGAKQPANRKIRAMTAETYDTHIGGMGGKNKATPPAWLAPPDSAHQNHHVIPD